MENLRTRSQKMVEDAKKYGELMFAYLFVSPVHWTQQTDILIGGILTLVY
jgi:hypothetical protein